MFIISKMWEDLSVCTTERIFMAEDEAKKFDETPMVETTEEVVEEKETFAKSGKKSKKYIEEVKAEEERQERKKERAEADKAAAEKPKGAKPVTRPLIE